MLNHLLITTIMFLPAGAGRLHAAPSALPMLIPAPAYCAAGDARLDAQPRLWAERLNVDLGVIREGGIYDLTFLLTNKGDAPLVIHKVVSSCSCAVIQPEKNRLQAGESMALNATFDASGRAGGQRKTITLYSNDPLNPQLELSFSAQVETPFRLLPQDRLSFSNKRPGEHLDKTVDLMAGKAGLAVSVSQVDFDRPGISHESEPIVISGVQGQRFRFRLGLDVGAGAFHTRAIFRFQVGEEQFQTALPISGGVISDIAVLPQLLVTLDAVAPGAAIPYGRVTLRSIDQSKKFDILQVEAGPHLQYAISHDEERAGLVYHLDFRVADSAPPGPFAQPITILTNSRDQAMITIPAYIFVAGKVAVKPPGVYLRSVGGQEVQVVKLYCRSCQGFRIESASSNTPHVIVAVINNPAAEHQQQAVVSLAKNAPPGQHHAVITVHTNAEGVEPIKLRVIAEVVEPELKTGQP